MAISFQQPSATPRASFRRYAGVLLLAILMLGIGGGYLYQTGIPQNNPQQSLPSLQIGSNRVQAAQPARADFSIRVILTDEPVGELKVEIDGPYRIQLTGNGQVLGRELRGSGSIRVTKTGFLWGKKEYHASQIELVPEKSPGVWVNEHQYRGIVRLLRRRGQTLVAVNVLPLEEYLASVIDSEMPKAFPTAARQAQAIMARSFALYQIHIRSREFFDVYAGVQSQKYLGYQYRDAAGRRLAGESTESRAVVEQTRGMVCLDRGKLFRTYYSAVCGGSTTSGREIFPDTPIWLTGVPCTWCSAADRYRWKTEFDRKEFFKQIGPLLQAENVQDTRATQVADQRISAVEPLPHAQPGLLPRFLVTHQGRQRVLTGVEIRNEMGTSTLYSPKFSLEPTSSQIHVRGSGHGHGVGLCQWGARGLALEGKTCLEIVKYYYPRADVVVLEPAR
ncbi:MAG: SpoIID/LytB domain-containing protein [Planctomycetaceae bacterium]